MELSYTSLVVTTISHNVVLAGSLIAVVALLTWRFVTFTLWPLLYPDDPKEYPYWIPFVGHLGAFFSDSNRLLTKSRLYFNDTREPYALTVVGQKWYIVTDATDVTATYRVDNGSLSYDIFAEEVMRMIDISEEGIRKIFKRDGPRSLPQDANEFSGSCKTLVQYVRESARLQLLPGEKLDHVLDVAIKYFVNSARIEAISDRSWYMLASSEKGITISLYDWLSDTFIGMGQKVYFGTSLENTDPTSTRTFMVFEDRAWQVMYQYPRFLCGEMTAAKTKLQAMMAAWLATPIKTRSDASWFILDLEEEMQRLKISMKDQAIIMFQLFWSINANVRKAPFWMLSHMLFDPELLAAIRAETASAIDPTTSDVNLTYLADSCPRLNSLWNEIMRTTAVAASVRFVTRDIQLGGKTLRKGNRIMMPQRQLHHNEQIFGVNATEFDASRFLKEPNLLRNPALRPFGGGISLCPGRVFAKLTTMAFVAIVLNRFDIMLDSPGQKFPVPADAKPTLGLVDPVEGSDLKVRLTARIRKDSV